MSRSRPDDRQSLGRRGESVAAAKLEREGFEIVARNARVGRLELDLIARRGGLVVICEVRSLRSDRLYAPALSVGPKKQARIRQAAARWLAENPMGPVQVRFDVASVVFDGPGGEPRVDYYERAF
ncbi:MAG: YraN family protein [Myxococcota bacterium]